MNREFLSKLPCGMVIKVLICLGVLAILFTNCDPVGVDFQNSEYSALSGDHKSFITINNGDDFTNKSRVDLTLQSSFAVEMYLTSNPDCQSDGSWEAYKRNQSWELNVENKELSIYVTFKDQNGYTSECIQDSIIHDNTPPTVSFGDIETVKTSRQATINYLVTDNLSGAKEESCTLDSMPMPCSNSRFLFTNSSGPHFVGVVATDRAGNSSQPFYTNWESDFDPPTVEITLGPLASSLSGPNVDFEFRGHDKHSNIKSYKCYVDNSPERDCQSPHSLSLIGGSHVFTVVAIDDFGNRSVPDRREWSVDSTFPSVSITKGPDNPTNSAQARFEFEATDDNRQEAITFECRLNGNTSYTPCSSGQSYSHLSPGQHEFSLRVGDSVGNTSEIIYQWVVDTSAPIISFLLTPDDLTNESTANFAWSVTEEFGIASTEYFYNGQSVNGSGFSHQLTGLTEGRHNFQVKVTDEAGNSNLVQYQWQIDQTPPTVNITSTPIALTNNIEATFTFDGMDVKSSLLQYRCRIDTPNFEDCQSPHIYSGLGHGQHIFYVVAIDEAGNSSEEKSYKWFVVSEPPVIQWVQRPLDHNQDESIVVEFSVTNDSPELEVVSIECRFDNDPFQDCEANQPQTFSGLAVGWHAFTVRAKNQFGHTGTLTQSWNVNIVVTPDIICDPLEDPSDVCSTHTGLIGYLYYLNLSHLRNTPIHGLLFKAKLDDYQEYGHRVDTVIHMSQVNVPKQEFDEGFRTSSGNLIQDDESNTLTKWFSIRLISSILPNTSDTIQSYEFAMVSDDGMRVILNGQKILEDDGNHVPRWTCSQESYRFSPSGKQPIEIHYFQGHANLVAMQLFYRVAGSGSGCPTEDSDEDSDIATQNWQIVPPGFFVRVEQ